MIHAATTPVEVLHWIFAVAAVIVWLWAVSDRGN